MYKMGLVFLGGGIGSLFRYGITRWMSVFFLSAFPFGTLLVNMLGSLIIGIAYAKGEGLKGFEEYGKYFIVTGILGGFTTFSTFSFDAVVLLKNNQLLPAFAYVSGSLLACIGGAALGYYLFKQ